MMVTGDVDICPKVSASATRFYHNLTSFVKTAAKSLAGLQP